MASIIGVLMVLESLRSFLRETRDIHPEERGRAADTSHPYDAAMVVPAHLSARHVGVWRG
jgi:hypothetical protein